MTDFAHLGMTFSTSGADEAAGKMKAIETQAKSTEKATESLAAAQESASASFGKISSGATASSASLAGLSKDLAANRQAALDAAVANGELVRVINSANGAVSYAPRLAKETTEAKQATAALSDAVRTVAADNDNAAGAASRHAGAVKDVAGAALDAAASTGGWTGELAGLVRGFAAFGAAQAVVQAIGAAFAEGAAQTKRAADAAADYAHTLDLVAAAAGRASAATFRLADARAEAARQAINQNIAANQKRLGEIDNPGLMGGVGRLLGTITGLYRGEDDARLKNQLQQQNNELLGAKIQLMLKDNGAQEAAQKLLDQALPKEKQLRDLHAQQNAIRREMTAGRIGEADGLRAIAALDDEARKALEGHTSAKVAHTRASHERKAALSDEAKALKELQRFSDAQDKTLTHFGMSSADADQVEALTRANQALDMGYVGLAAHIASTAAQLAELRGIERAEIDTNPHITKTVTDLQAAWAASQKGASGWIDRVKEAAQAAQVFQSSVQGLAGALRHGDWATAAIDLANVAKTLQATWARGQHIQAIGQGATALGGVIGGRAGGVLSGVGGGIGLASTLGMLPGLGALGGPVGLIAGGVLGAIGSLFGGGKSRQQRRDEENQRAEQAAQKAQQIADQRRQLEMRLVTASGDQIAILNAQRADELSQVDATNKALLQQVQDAEQAAARRDQVQSIELAYLKLAGRDLDALNLQRAQELKAIDATLAPLQRLLYAAQDATDAADAAKTALQQAADAELARLQSDVARAHDNLAAAYDRESGALNDTINTFRQFSQTLHDFRRGLDADATGLSPENAYMKAKSAFDDVQRRARLGDAEAIGQFTSAGEAFRQASATYNGVGGDYFRDLADIKDATDAAAATADRTVDVAQAQLAQLKELVRGYLDLNDSVISVDEGVRQLLTAQQALQDTQNTVNAVLGVTDAVLGLGAAMSAYQAAVSAQTAATAALADAVAAAKANPANQPPPAQPLTSGGYTSTNGDYAAYVEANADLKSLFDAQGGMARGRTEAEFGAYHWTQFGTNENRGVRPFAGGGSFEVGGVGGVDSQHVEFRASPDETVTVRTPQQMAREAAALEQLAAETRRGNGLLDALIYEAKADKIQLAGAVRVLRKGQERMVDAMETFKRRVA